MARSNRQITQLTVNQLHKALAHGPERLTKSVFGNTEVEAIHYACKLSEGPHIEIRLFGKAICQLYTSPVNSQKIIGTILKTGDFYDGKGRPSRTTRERLNGILDALGSVCVLPEGVRVFFDENGECCLGKGQACVKFDSTRSAVTLLADPHNVVFK